MIQLKLALGEGALDEAALPIAELAGLVVAPEEEGAEVESGEAVPLAAGQMGDMQRLLVLIKSIVHFREILDQSEVLEVGGAVDPELALQVVPTCIDELLDGRSLVVPDLGDHHRVLLSARGVDDELAV